MFTLQLLKTCHESFVEGKSDVVIVPTEPPNIPFPINTSRILPNVYKGRLLRICDMFVEKENALCNEKLLIMN